MKKILALSLASMFLGLGSLYASDKFNLPSNQRGEPMNGYIPWQNTRINHTTEVLVCTGRCLLGPVIQSTGANGNWWAARNTGTADAGNSAWTIGPVEFATINTAPGKNAVQAHMLHSVGIAIKLGAVGASEWIEVNYLDLDPS